MGVRVGRIDPLDGGYGLRSRPGKRAARLDTEFYGHLGVRLFLFGVMGFGLYMGGEDLIQWLEGLTDSLRTLSASGPVVVPR